MNITCRHCNTRLTIPAHKIPVNKDAVLKCPKCKGSVQVHAKDGSQVLKEIKAPGAALAFEDRQSALICIDSGEIKKKIHPLLRQLGFDIEIAQNAGVALGKMEYNMYHLLLIEQDFDQQGGFKAIIDRLNATDMSLRRRMVMVLISKKFKTSDDMATLHASVNGIIREEDIVHLDAFLLRTLAGHRQFYLVFNDSLKQVGRA